jgi:hypothetical protein
MIYSLDVELVIIIGSPEQKIFYAPAMNVVLQNPFYRVDDIVVLAGAAPP